MNMIHMPLGFIIVLVIFIGVNTADAVVMNTTNSTEILGYVENNIIRGLDDTRCPPDYYGGNDTGLYDLLDRWCYNEPKPK
jgi:hypothetical protein